MLASNTCIELLRQAGISRDDAAALRRISMALHRWHELECGDGNNYGSWTIARGRKVNGAFVHDDDGKPYLEHHHYLHLGKDYVTYSPMPDRERGALKRLQAIMARYPGFGYYVQGDPRGASLYILSAETLAKLAPDVAATMRTTLDLSAVYNRGIAVYK